MFDPYDLSIDVTPEGVASALKERKFSDALMMSFRLNERQLIVKSLEAIPLHDSECAWTFSSSCNVQCFVFEALYFSQI